MNCTGGPGKVTCTTTTATHPLIAIDSRENSFAIQVRLRRTSVPGIADCNNDPTSDYHNNCRWFFTSSTTSRDTPPTGAQVLDFPVHRSFMGHLERTGPIKWLRLTVDKDCNLGTLTDRIIGHDLLTGEDAASQPIGEQRCYALDLGMAGGLAQDQDEPPIVFNLGDNSSQRAYVDCDPDLAEPEDRDPDGLSVAPVRREQVRHDAVLPGTQRMVRQGQPADGRLAALPLCPDPDR